jgi:hypothetical protein
MLMKKRKKQTEKLVFIAGLSTGLLIARRASTSRPYERTARTAIKDLQTPLSSALIFLFFLLS